jgi:gamma-glutamyl:cysteine ligase YbdK (ATP-grasp superfamily)
MGVKIDREHFDEVDYLRFRQRLEDCLAALRELLQRPGFGTGQTTIGAELELFLVDDQSRPLPSNQSILDAVGDDRLSLEIDRFNLELNPSPLSLACRPFSAMGAEMAELLGLVRAAARERAGRAAMIGILPTLHPSDLQRACITDAPRYRALNHALGLLRQGPIRVTISGAGAERVELERDDVAIEGANTSFQAHLRVDPDRFTAAYNAGQMATAPVLAVAGNSPVFLGRQLWDETRVALFEQSADDRHQPRTDRRVPRVSFGTDWASDGAIGLFEESVRRYEPLLPVVSGEDPRAVVAKGGMPCLDELRLHQSTVWRWNRAIYDAGFGGHLRVELRALPAGPTIVDMLANAAFLIGLTLALEPQMTDWARTFPFAHAQANFYQSARQGLDAELWWPTGPRSWPQRVGAPELALRLLPEAAKALKEAGVASEEADRLLGVITDRVVARQTGAVWQRRALAAAEQGLGRERALHRMLERYLELSAAERPVHTWPVDL